MNAANGGVFLNKRLSANATLLIMIWQTYAPLGVAALEFSVVGGDLAMPRLESRLDYAKVFSYPLTVAAYDTFRPVQVINASVRIDLQVRTSSLG